MLVNWNDKKSMVSRFFTVHETTWLPSWGIHHEASDLEKANILKMAAIMDRVREQLGRPINVHVWIRPGAVNCPGSPHHGQDYNAYIKGAKNSAHKSGLAVDFDCGEDCDLTRKKLEPLLDSFGVCMERMPGGPWVHLDIYPPRGTTRYFIP